MLTLVNLQKKNQSSKVGKMIFGALWLHSGPLCTGAKTKIDPIHLLQKKAIRICTGSQYLAHTNPLFNELKTLNVFHINSLQSLLFMFKNNLLPYSFHNFFILNSTIHSYPTRNSPNFHLVNPRLLICYQNMLNQIKYNVIYYIQISFTPNFLNFRLYF